jgi:predicted phosphodiesterase
MERAIAEGARYLCHGHTHRQADDRQGSTRVLNPGALFRAKTYSVGLLDTEADRFDLIDVSS